MLYIFIDGWCKKCKKIGDKIKRIDTLHQVTIRDMREDDLPTDVDIEKALKVIASVNDEGKVFYGYDTLIQISARIPWLWIFVPLFFLAKWLLFGPYLYNMIAAKRKIIYKHDQHCSECS